LEGLDAILRDFNFYFISYNQALNYSKNILSYILLFVFGFGIINLVLSSTNFKEFLCNFGLLLLALFSLALISKIYTIILDNFFLTVLGVIFNLIDLDLGFLKMDQNQSNLNHQGNFNSPVESNSQLNPNPQKPELNNIDNEIKCIACKIKQKLEARKSDPDIQQGNTARNIFFNFEK